MRLGLGVQENIEEEDEHQDGYKEDKMDIKTSQYFSYMASICGFN